MQTEKNQIESKAANAFPMSFNAAMAARVLSGDKNCTRRPFQLQPDADLEKKMRAAGVLEDKTLSQLVDGAWHSGFLELESPSNVGDLLWLREPHRVTWVSGDMGEPYIEPPVWFEAGGNPEDEECYFPDEKAPSELWRSASRMTLKVTDTRIERLMDITEEQASAEGFEGCLPTAKAAFLKMWDSIYGNSSENPFVWVIEFEVIHQNIDEIQEAA